MMKLRSVRQTLIDFPRLKPLARKFVFVFYEKQPFRKRKKNSHLVFLVYLVIPGFQTNNKTISGYI